MTTRADVDRLLSANQRLVEMAKRDLAELFASFDLSRPELVRDALLEVTPMLVREYGDIATAVTAEWYEEVRAASVAGRTPYVARTVAGVAADEVEGIVRWSAKELFGDEPDKVLALLFGSMQRFIMYSSRETVARNVRFDPDKPRYARVPSGAKTCAFCTLLASRGFVFTSEWEAQHRGRNQDDDKYHNYCDCQVIPEWDSDGAHIEGYDPDEMFEMYKAARKKSGSADIKQIAAKMRRMFPDSFTDGVYDD